MKEKMQKIKLIRYLLLCLGISAMVFLLYGIGKSVWFCDEMYTYTIANNGSFGMSFSEQSWCSGNDIANVFFVANDGVQFEKAIECTKTDNHPPVYYLLFHLMSALFGRYSKWIGLLTNLPFFLGVILLLYLLLYKYSHNELISFLGSVIVAFNGGILSTALLIRMYMLMIFLVFLFLFFLYQLYSGKKHYGIYLGLSICTIIGFLTNYIYAIYAVYISVAYLIYCLLKKNYKEYIKYIITMCVSAIVAIMLFPESIKHIFVENKGSSAFEKATHMSAFFHNTFDAVRCQNQLLYSKFYILGIIVTVVITILFIIKLIKNKKDSVVGGFVLSNLAASFLYMITVRHVFLAENRYLYLSMYLQYTLMIFMIIYLLKNTTHEKTVAFSVFGILLIANLVVNIPNPQIEYYGTDEIKTQRKLLETENETPWIYYGHFDWVSMYCALDFTIPELIYCVETNSQPLYDEILAKEDRYIVYLNQSYGKIDDLIIYLEQSIGTDYDYNIYMEDRLHLKVYEVYKVPNDQTK